jgi:hypothetical protein
MQLPGTSSSSRSDVRHTLADQNITSPRSLPERRFDDIFAPDGPRSLLGNVARFRVVVLSSGAPKSFMILSNKKAC